MVQSLLKANLIGPSCTRAVKLIFQAQHSAITTYLETRCQMSKNTAFVIRRLSSLFTHKMSSVGWMVKPVDAEEELLQPTGSKIKRKSWTKPYHQERNSWKRICHSSS